MKIVYMGTPDFSVLPLKEIVACGKYEVVGVCCNKDKPVGRKQILTPPPVKTVAESLGIPVFQYAKIREEGVEDLKRLNPDLIVTCAFGQILSQEILDIPKICTLNIHASLLPKYRGASPINYAILYGEKKTGITIMRTDKGIDTGDILFEKETEIYDGETAGELFIRLSTLGANCIVDALDMIEKGVAEFSRQDEKSASYTKIIKKEDAKIIWTESAEKSVNRIRAFNPSPVAYTYLNGEPLKIYKAKVVEGKGNAGEVVKSDGELLIGTGEKLLSIEVLQKAGGKPLSVAEFLRGNKIPTGTVLS